MQEPITSCFSVKMLTSTFSVKVLFSPFFVIGVPELAVFFAAIFWQQ
jgi:hypothetical protein